MTRACGFFFLNYLQPLNLSEEFCGMSNGSRSSRHLAHHPLVKMIIDLHCLIMRKSLVGHAPGWSNWFICHIWCAIWCPRMTFLPFDLELTPLAYFQVQRKSWKIIWLIWAIVCQCQTSQNLWKFVFLFLHYMAKMSQMFHFEFSVLGVKVSLEWKEYMLKWAQPL